LQFNELVELLGTAHNLDLVADTAVPEFRDDGGSNNLFLCRGAPLEIDNPCCADEQTECDSVRPEVEIVDVWLTASLRPSAMAAP